MYLTPTEILDSVEPDALLKYGTKDKVWAAELTRIRDRFAWMPSNANGGQRELCLGGMECASTQDSG